MEYADHFPFHTPWSDAERAELIADVTAALGQLAAAAQPAPTIAPVEAAPALPARFVKRYGVIYCQVCDLDARYCKGHAPPDAMSNDAARADRNLEQRVRDHLASR